MKSTPRIFPLIIFIVALAFSLRLAEVMHRLTHIDSLINARAADAIEKPGEKPAEKPTEKPDAAAAEKTQSAKTPAGAAAKSAGSAAAPRVWPDAGDADMEFAPSRMEIFQDLVRRREALDKRENDIMAREALLKAAEQEIAQKYQELSQLRGEVEKLLARQSDEEMARTRSLVKIYEGMKPADAARIFDTLDLDILLNVMSNMSERKLGPVLAQMSADRARTITTMMAEQKKMPDLPQAK